MVALPVLGAWAVVLATPAAADDETVQATNANVFAPASVTIDVDDTVTWDWTGANVAKEHTVTASSSNWTIDDTLTFGAQTTTFTFEEPGVYTYYCNNHGSATDGMRGSVKVIDPNPPPSPTPTPTKSPTPKPTPKPTPTKSPSPSPTATTPQPEPTQTATVPIPSTSPPGPVPTSRPPVIAPTPSPTPAPALTGIGLTAPPATGRDRGLPIALAMVAIGGVVSAQVRTLLAAADDL